MFKAIKAAEKKMRSEEEGYFDDSEDSRRGGRRSRRRGGAYSGGSRSICFVCGDPNHMVDYCSKKGSLATNKEGN